VQVTVFIITLFIGLHISNMHLLKTTTDLRKEMQGIVRNYKIESLEALRCFYPFDLDSALSGNRYR
jgi:hypothetical protein